MNLVLGVTVGASAVRLARPGTPDHGGPVFRSRAIERGREIPEDVAAESIRVALAEFTGAENAVAVVYRDQAQAGALTAALDRGAIEDCRLVPESAAILRMLEEPGTLSTQNTLVIVDLGSTGTTVDVVDRVSGSTVVTARSSQVSGDHFDALVYRDQIDRRRIVPPGDPESRIELQARCRLAKEQLSTRSAVCLPGPGGLLLLSREVFDSLVAQSVEALAREIREVIATSGRRPDAVVLIGGGARVPIIRTVLELWLEVPVIAPEHPDILAAQGAALIADETSEAGAAIFAASPVTPSVAPIFAPYPLHTPAALPEPVPSFAHGGIATLAGPARTKGRHEAPADMPPETPAGTLDSPAGIFESPTALESSTGIGDGSGIEEPAADESIMIDAPAYSAVRENLGNGQPSWLGTTAPDEAVENSKKQFRFAGLGAGVVAAIIIVGLGIGYGGKVFGDSGESGPVVNEVTATSALSTPPPTSTTTPPPPPPTTTPPPPPPTSEVVEVPVTQAPYVEPYVAPYVAPAPPPPALYIPGLPPILLPDLRIPGF